MGRSHRTPARRRRLLAGLFAALAVLVGSAGAATAHPLGNFTINHYAGVRIEPDRILLDVVIDEAEIPAFQSRQAIDRDEDGDLTDAELRDGAQARCLELLPGLQVSVGDDVALSLRLDEAGLTFPLGASGLATLRLVCVYSAPLPTAIAGHLPTRIAVADTSRQDRLGWREVVTIGDGVAIAAVEGELRSTSPSARLTAYPDDLLARPLADGRVVVDALADASVSAPAFDVPDADPVEAGVATPGPGASASPSADPSASAGPSASPGSTPRPSASAAAVPGGIGGELPTIFNEADLTPVVVLLSVLTAAALGAGHALTPGHGKTLMAAYLVGTRGTSVHALGLGLSVSVSHTVGILVLAGIVVGAADVLPPDLVVRTAPLIAAVSILAIGAWMLIGEWRRRSPVHDHVHEDVPEHPRSHAGEHDDLHAGAHEHAHPHAGEHEPAHAGDHDHGHPHAAEHEHAHAAEHRHEPPDRGEHSHGGIRHSHLPAAGSTISWRSLFVLGLAGGLIPSVSALLILLGAIAAGRPAFGFVLVVAFGFGMAAVMAGIGLAMVFARERLDRLPGGAGLDRIRAVVPLAAAVLVFGFGLVLTVQALSGTVAL